MYLCSLCTYGPHDGLILHPGSPIKVLDTRFWRPLRQNRGNRQRQWLCEMLPDFETQNILNLQRKKKKYLYRSKLGTKAKCDNNRMPILWKSSFSLIAWLTKQIPRCRVLLQKLLVSQLLKKFLTFYGNRMFITVFTKARHLFYPEGGQSSPCPPTHPSFS